MEEKLIKLQSRMGGIIYYAPEEKHFYVKRKKKKGKVYMSCYDIMAKKTLPTELQCPAKRVYTPEDELSRPTNTNHTNHENHELMYRDLVSLNNMKDHCNYTATNFPTSANKVSVREIFLLELAKYVFHLILYNF